MPILTVVKVGGSLLDVPRLGPHLHDYLQARFSPPSPGVLLFPGGGATADLVRHHDRCQGLGPERAHWLAIRSLSLNAHLLANLLPAACVVQDLHECAPAWQAGHPPILDPVFFFQQDEGRPGALPPCWDVTSDSLAARVAVVTGATRLVLLKSAPLPSGAGWAEAGRRGYVDPFFAEVIRQSLSLQVEAVSLRDWIRQSGQSNETC